MKQEVPGSVGWDKRLLGRAGPPKGSGFRVQKLSIESIVNHSTYPLGGRLRTSARPHSSNRNAIDNVRRAFRHAPIGLNPEP